jgi:hypothetical protein
MVTNENIPERYEIINLRRYQRSWEIRRPHAAEGQKIAFEGAHSFGANVNLLDNRRASIVM